MASVLLRAHVGVIGEAEVGKTALLRAFEKKHYFQQQYIMTQGAQLFVQVVHLDDGRQGERQTDAVSRDTDRSQHEHPVELYLTELTECPYVLVCFDTTRRSTLDAVLQQFHSYKQHLSPAHPPQLALLVGCKSDRRADSEVTADDCEERASEMGLVGYVECSAATGDGVEELFERVARHVADRYDAQNVSKRVEHPSSDDEEASPREPAQAQEQQPPPPPQQSRELNADDSDDD